MSRHYWLYLSAAMAALTFADSAYAQSSVLDEVVVTAEKRSENVQKTPIAITTVSGTEIADRGITNVENLDRTGPSLHTFNQAGNTRVVIRGVMNANFASGQTIAYNVDGVSTTHENAIGGAFFDVDRIEVLRGPQGTLYGRDAIGGAVNVITRKPGPEFGGYATVGLGNYQLAEFEGAVNIPLSESFQARAAFRRQTHDGYVSRGFNDADEVAARLHLQFRPTDDFTMLLTADYANQGGTGIADLVFPTAANPWTPLPQYVASQSHRDNTQRGAHAQIDWNLGFATLTSISAYQKLDTNFDVQFVQGRPQTLVIRTKDVSQELRLGSNTKADAAGSLQWVVGLYSFKEEQQSRRAYRVFPAKISDFSDDLNDLAAFGQATYALTDNLRLTAGVRSTRNHKETNGRSGSQANASANPVLFPVVGTAEWKPFTYRVGAEWQATANSLLYASVSKGFQQGGFYNGNPAGRYAPETLIDYEVGSKNRLFGNTMQLNASAYYYDLKDFQSNIQIPLGNNGEPNLTAFFNVGAVRLYGGEIELIWNITSADQLQINGSTAKSKVTQWTPPHLTGVTIANLLGKKLPLSPDWELMLAYQHVFTLPNEGRLTARVQTDLSSGYETVIQALPGTAQGHYALSDANLSYESPDRRWEVSAWIRNIDNRAVRIGVVSAGVNYQYLASPRTYGLKLSAHF